MLLFFSDDGVFFVVYGIGHLLLGLSAWQLNPFLYSGNLLAYEP